MRVIGAFIIPGTTFMKLPPSTRFLHLRSFVVLAVTCSALFFLVQVYLVIWLPNLGPNDKAGPVLLADLARVVVESDGKLGSPDGDNGWTYFVYAYDPRHPPRCSWGEGGLPVVVLTEPRCSAPPPPPGIGHWRAMRTLRITADGRFDLAPAPEVHANFDVPRGTYQLAFLCEDKETGRTAFFLDGYEGHLVVLKPTFESWAFENSMVTWRQ